MENEDMKEVVLQHQLEEWKLLNEYINSMDTGYQQSITIVVSVFAIVATVLSQSMNQKWQWGIFIIPLGLIAFFAYVSYQFRITAILRGHLAALEESMNKKINENVHMWNSALVETFMAHNNKINNLMMVPMIVFLISIILYCVRITYYLLIEKNNGINFGIAIFIIYWTVVALLISIVFVPFLNNENVRHETYYQDRVLEKYKEYKEVSELKTFTYEPVEKGEK